MKVICFKCTVKELKIHVDSSERREFLILRMTHDETLSTINKNPFEVAVKSSKVESKTSSVK